MLAGFIVIVCEAPCCCFFIDYVQTLSDKVETRPYWNKAALYCGGSIDDMRTSAANLESGLGQPMSAPRANLVSNEQPVSFTGTPTRH
ncbi:Transmembrane protein, partial [Operophtera brumata]